MATISIHPPTRGPSTPHEERTRPTTSIPSPTPPVPPNPPGPPTASRETAREPLAE
jgi:hypothetical protein